MMELLLNFAWAAIAIAAFVFVPRRDARALAAIACVLALLFPIVSASDDLSADASTLAKTLSAILAIAGIIITLVAMARIVSDSRRFASFVLVVHADPRSPPRR